MNRGQGPRAQQGGVATVGAGDHAPDRDAGPVDHQGAFGALFAAIDRRFAGGVPTAGRFDDAPIDGHVLQVQAHDAVVGLERGLFQPGEGAGSDPLIATITDGGRRAGRVRGFRVANAVDQDLDQLVEHDPVSDAWAMTSPRVEDLTLRQQRRELVPQGFDDGRWQCRHGLLDKNGVSR